MSAPVRNSPRGGYICTCNGMIREVLDVAPVVLGRPPEVDAELRRLRADHERLVRLQAAARILLAHAPAHGTSPYLDAAEHLRAVLDPPTRAIVKRDRPDGSGWDMVYDDDGTPAGTQGGR